ncbi:hypothetical protein [Micromonospora inyonensis]|nr:hypothetical protein [Micromonospora inyonensis]
MTLGAGTFPGLAGTISNKAGPGGPGIDDQASDGGNLGDWAGEGGNLGDS